MIPVTKPFLPPIQEYNYYLDGIWQRNWLTNNGPLVNELELRLKEYLGLDHLLFLSNGTIALQIAIKALNLSGEIITTPFSYVATTSSIVWEGCKPVFVDIDKKTLNIDSSKIESAITEKTSGILATHVYGNPCDIEKIDQIAKKHNIKVIYDAAHCFGTTYKGKSIFSYGDISTTSFHATKLFHSIEGGAVITQQSDLLKKMAFLRNFGHNGPEKFESVGINGKNSEFHAAMGLSVLPHIEKILQSRKQQVEYYKKKLNGLNKQDIEIGNDIGYNFAYYPIILPNEEILIRVFTELNLNNIYPRRYFYPSLSKLPYVIEQETPVCNDIATRVLCLPIYYGLSNEEIDFVCRILLRVQNN